jgi:hypothetical protein
MIRWSRLVPALAVTALLAACANDTDTPLAPSDAPALNNGSPGSGTAAGGGSSSFGGTSSSTSDEGGDPVPSDSTGRGGHIVGGN